MTTTTQDWSTVDQLPEALPATCQRVIEQTNSWLEPFRKAKTVIVAGAAGDDHLLQMTAGYFGQVTGKQVQVVKGPEEAGSLPAKSITLALARTPGSWLADGAAAGLPSLYALAAPNHPILDHAQDAVIIEPSDDGPVPTASFTVYFAAAAALALRIAGDEDQLDRLLNVAGRMEGDTAEAHQLVDDVLGRSEEQYFEADGP